MRSLCIGILIHACNHSCQDARAAPFGHPALKQSSCVPIPLPVECAAGVIKPEDAAICTSLQSAEECELSLDVTYEQVAGMIPANTIDYPILEVVNAPAFENDNRKRTIRAVSYQSIASCPLEGENVKLYSGAKLEELSDTGLALDCTSARCSIETGLTLAPGFYQLRTATPCVYKDIMTPHGPKDRDLIVQSVRDEGDPLYLVGFTLETGVNSTACKHGEMTQALDVEQCLVATAGVNRKAHITTRYLATDNAKSDAQARPSPPDPPYYILSLRTNIFMRFPYRGLKWFLNGGNMGFKTPLKSECMLYLAELEFLPKSDGRFQGYFGWLRYTDCKVAVNGSVTCIKPYEIKMGNDVMQFYAPCGKGLARPELIVTSSEIDNSVGGNKGRKDVDYKARLRFVDEEYRGGEICQYVGDAFWFQYCMRGPSLYHRGRMTLETSHPIPLIEISPKDSATEKTLVAFSLGLNTAFQVLKWTVTSLVLESLDFRSSSSFKCKPGSVSMYVSDRVDLDMTKPDVLNLGNLHRIPDCELKKNGRMECGILDSAWLAGDLFLLVRSTDLSKECIVPGNLFHPEISLKYEISKFLTPLNMTNYIVFNPIQSPPAGCDPKKQCTDQGGAHTIEKVLTCLAKLKGCELKINASLTADAPYEPEAATPRNDSTPLNGPSEAMTFDPSRFPLSYGYPGGDFTFTATGLKGLKGKCQTYSYVPIQRAGRFLDATLSPRFSQFGTEERNIIILNDTLVKRHDDTVRKFRNMPEMSDTFIIFGNQCIVPIHTSFRPTITFTADVGNAAASLIRSTQSSWEEKITLVELKPLYKGHIVSDEPTCKIEEIDMVPAKCTVNRGAMEYCIARMGGKSRVAGCHTILTSKLSSKTPLATVPLLLTAGGVVQTVKIIGPRKVVNGGSAVMRGVKSMHMKNITLAATSKIPFSVYTTDVPYSKTLALTTAQKLPATAVVWQGSTSVSIFPPSHTLPTNSYLILVPDQRVPKSDGLSVLTTGEVVLEAKLVARGVPARNED